MLSKHPILFSTPMVAAILDDKKSMTRRALNPQPVLSADNCPDRAKVVNALSDTDNSLFYFWKHFPLPGFPDNTDHIRSYCPYGKVGDVLWCREEHFRYGHWEAVPGIKTATGRQKWAFVPDTKEVRYYDNPPAAYRGGRHHKDPYTPAWHKRLARFMYYDHCRLFLRITDIRVERLQDITEEDAIAEGVIQNRDGSWHDYIEPKRLCQDDAKAAFISLWESINGPGSWQRNDLVWVVSFAKTDKPE